MLTWSVYSASEVRFDFILLYKTPGNPVVCVLSFIVVLKRIRDSKS
jgi:hypothetical protein